MINNVINNDANKLSGFDLEIKNFTKLFNKKLKPQVYMLSGKKGIGKCTFINHLFCNLETPANYLDNQIKDTKMFKSFYDSNLNTKFIYLNSNNCKIDDVRSLRTVLNSKKINNANRYIVLDDVELLNINCSNALLKVLEEPNKKDFFFLINNQSKKVLDTIKSRSIEFKFFLNERDRLNIISSLINYHKFKNKIDYNRYRISPGLFMKYNQILDDNNIDINSNLFENIKILVTKYKVKKDILFKDLVIYLINQNYDKKYNSKINLNKIINEKQNIFKEIYNFFIYGLNDKSIINSISERLRIER